jgi:hypothetical protein
MVRREAGEPPPQRLHFRRSVEPEEAAECGRVSFLEMLGPLDARSAMNRSVAQGRRRVAVPGQDLILRSDDQLLDRIISYASLEHAANKSAQLLSQQKVFQKYISPCLAYVRERASSSFRRSLWQVSIRARQDRNSRRLPL